MRERYESTIVFRCEYNCDNRRLFCIASEFQEAFQLFDSRGDGKIHVAQIGDALRALGQNPTESDVKKFTHQHKPDERISFEVFLPIYQAISKSRTSDTADDFIEGLRHFDKDGNGFISSAELRHLLTTLGMRNKRWFHLYDCSNLTI